MFASRCARPAFSVLFSFKPWKRFEKYTPFQLGSITLIKNKVLLNPTWLKSFSNHSRGQNFLLSPALEIRHHLRFSSSWNFYFALTATTYSRKRLENCAPHFWWRKKENTITLLSLRARLFWRLHPTIEAEDKVKWILPQTSSISYLNCKYKTSSF